MKIKKYIKYIHYGNEVSADEELIGKHREHCLCHSCINLKPGLPEENCPIANLLYAVCLAHHIVTPVYECPLFIEAKNE